MLGKKLAQKITGSGFLRSLLKNNLFSGPFNGVKHNTYLVFWSYSYTMYIVAVFISTVQGTLLLQLAFLPPLL